jgi:hypothetical protein
VRIDYYENQEAYENGNVASSIYSRINCDELIKTKDKSGNEKVTCFRGDNLVQLDKRGIYVVSELSSWSATDYDQTNSSYTEIAIKTYDDEGVDQVLIYPKEATLSASADIGTDNSVKLTMPRLTYSSGAIPTSMGINISNVPTVEFNNLPSEYAYISSQAYSANNILPKVNR